MSRLHVAGVALRGSGYPNAEQTVRALRASEGWQVEDSAAWLPESVHLWRIARGPLWGRLALALRLTFGNLFALLRLMVAVRRRPGLVYVPYPAAFLLWWASWMPRRWRPRMVADAYISLWDSAFRDRASSAHGQGNSLPARLAKAFEGRALRAAQVVLVDTVANQSLMVSEFALDPSRVLAVPLAIDVAPFLATPSAQAPTPGSPMRVLFVGTLIPLHGIGVIAKAVAITGPEAGIVFHIVGDGQEASTLEALLASEPDAPVVWERGWQSLQEVAQRVHRADVCLGVFGGEGKAARVLPFKLYMALAAGKAIVSQTAYSLPAGVPALPARTIAPDASALVEALKDLRRDHAERQSLASQAAEFHRIWLGEDALRRAWQDVAARGNI